MSLEMLANPDYVLDKSDLTTLEEALRILGRCGVADTDAVADRIRDGRQVCLPDGLRSHLLAAAQQELHAIHRYLTWRHIIWASFRHRNERAVLRPYRHPRHRQAFHDGVCVAQLLVAVRQALMPGAQDVGKLIKKVVRSLEFAICNPECEMERPSEWIGNDPDFRELSGGQNDCFMAFLDDQWKRDYPVGG